MDDLKLKAIARIPCKPLSFANKELAEAKELLIDYENGNIYVCKEDGTIINTTTTVKDIIVETLDPKFNSINQEISNTKAILDDHSISINNINSDINDINNDIIETNEIISQKESSINEKIDNTNKNMAANASAINKNASDIATNKTNISSNTSAINTNKNNIATNASAIATNKTNISSNSSAINTNKNNIATNASAIATNKTNISSNSSNISKNSTFIATNKTDISNIFKAIKYNQNTSKIEITTEDIIETQNKQFISLTEKNKLNSMGYTYGTSDLVDGSSPLATGMLYFVYE